MKTTMQILRDLAPLNRAVCSRGYDQAVDYLCEVLPFRVIPVPSSHQHNGWVIPPSWDVEEARIGKTAARFMTAPQIRLRDRALRRALRARNPEELRQHLHYDHRDDGPFPSITGAIPKLEPGLGSGCRNGSLTSSHLVITRS